MYQQPINNQYNNQQYPQQTMSYNPYYNQSAANRNFPPQYIQNNPQLNTPQNSIPNKTEKKQKKKGNHSARNKILLIFTILGLILGTTAFVVVDKYVRQLTVISLPGVPIIEETSTPIKASQIKEEQTEIIKNNAAQNTAASARIFANGLTDEKWDGNTRITCLAMGLDYRDWVENDGTPRSDTMMLLTYDPITKEAGMLSIPRDLWVAIPDHGYGRINTAYSMGEAEQLPGTNGKPGGGAGLAIRTVEMFLGVDIQYYAVVDFYGFMDFIDAIDKLAINVRDDITVDPLGEGNTVRLMAGVQDLDGATALAYARYRYTQGGDFERAQRQQDVIYALYKQIKWQLPELLTTRFDAVFTSIQRAIKTNIPFDDMIKLAWTVTEIEPDKIKRAVIAPPYQVEYGRTSDGTQDILIPIPDKIREARDSIFAASSSGVQTSEEYTAMDRVRDEKARVTVLGGCSDVNKTNKVIEQLLSDGIQVVSAGQGNSGWNSSITIYTGTPYTAKYLQELMSIPTGNVTIQYDPNADVDILLNIVDSYCNTVQ